MEFVIVQAVLKNRSESYKKVKTTTTTTRFMANFCLQIRWSLEKEITFTSILKFSLYVVLWVALLRLLQTVATSERQVETFFDPYQILGLDSGATKEEIKKAFRTLSLRYHPDKSTEPDAENKYIAIQKAYETLTGTIIVCI